MGFQLGSKTSIDDRGRVTIPREIRRKLDLKKDQNLTVELRNKEIVLKPALQMEEFMSQLRGCVKGSRLKPTELKEIWGVTHAHN